MRVYTDSGATDATAQKDCLNAVSASYETIVDNLFQTTAIRVLTNPTGCWQNSVQCMDLSFNQKINFNKPNQITEQEQLL